MKKNTHPDSLITRTEHLRSIVGELSEVHSLLTVLYSQIEGGGIVQARHLEPAINEAVPRLRDAVDAIKTLTHQGGGRIETAESGSHRNPLLV